ncbi:MAG TPA: glutathione S-transferase family protein [Polyangiaceae bacterium]|nr:glutathione S-transferase family protein [Polyangiaceae bacterium]
MSELILHHYDSSPFAEKVRLVLGFKGLAWHSVTIPMVLPKPDVVALTGGYRRTPILQIGADVYCDTALVCRVLDRVAPEPPLYPASGGGHQHLVAQWADSALFWTAAPYTLQPAGAAFMFGGLPPAVTQGFLNDRAAMTAGLRRATPVDARAQLDTYFGWLESSLADGRPFLLGDAPCIADFSTAHSVWFLRRVPPVADVLEPFAKLRAWSDRVSAFGHGSPTPLSSDDALGIAARSASHAPAKVEPGRGFEAGAAVTVSAFDYATDPINGTLVGLTSEEVVVERRDERAGTVHVHFPRIGYQVKKADA